MRALIIALTIAILAVTPLSAGVLIAVRLVRAGKKPVKLRRVSLEPGAVESIPTPKPDDLPPAA